MNTSLDNTEKEHIYPVIRGNELEQNSSPNIAVGIFAFVGVPAIGYYLYEPISKVMIGIKWINNILPYFDKYFITYYCAFLFIIFAVCSIISSDKFNQKKNPELYSLFKYGDPYEATVMDYKTCEMEDYSYYLILRISTNEGPKDVEYKLRKDNKPFTIGSKVTLYIKDNDLYIYQLLDYGHSH